MRCVQNVIRLVALSAAAWVTPAVAGNEIGNGGDAVVCQSAKAEFGGRSAMLLDLYEARVRWHLTPDLGGAQLDVKAKAAFVFDRIAVIDFDRHARYRANLDGFWAEANLAPNLSLPTIPDAGVVELPGADCQVVQLAYQQTPQLPGDKRYNIRKEVWDLLDTDSQADLLVHEIIYREAIEHGQQNSRASRYFNAQLVANTVASMSMGQYSDLLEQYAELPAQRMLQGAAFYLRTMTLTPNGVPVSSTVFADGAIDGEFGPINVEAGDAATFTPAGQVQVLTRIANSPQIRNLFAPSCGDSNTLANIGTITFNDDRSLHSLDAAPGAGDLLLPICRNGGFYWFLFAPGLISFLPNNAVSGGVVGALYASDQVVTDACGHSIQLAVGSEVTFFPDGQARTGVVADQASFVCYESDKTAACPPGAAFELDEQGYLVHGCGLP